MDVKDIKVLLIEDEDFDVRRVQNTIKLFESSIIIRNIVSNGNDAINLITENPGLYDIIIMDYQIAGALRGEELIKKIKFIDSTLQIIVITKLTININDFDFAHRLMEAGAFWYCTKYPGDIDEYIYQPTDFLMSILNAYQKKQLEMQSNTSNLKLQRNIDDLLDKKKIISVSPVMEKLKGKILKLAESEIIILINGESGTGKELVAYNIHYSSKRKFENFVPINCGSIPNELLESELFGYEKGAFTGAMKSKAGLFEVADKGTIFLDEVAELSLNAQVKLLRVIQDGEIEKIGRTKSTKVDVRIIAATNKNLENEVNEGRFREDLYYRLNVLPVSISPLRERKEDIIYLMMHFIDTYAQEMGKTSPVIEEAAIKILSFYSWPGNVRQLKNVAQRLVFEADEVVTVDNVNQALNNKILKITENNKIFNFDLLKDIEALKDIEKTFRKEYFEFVRDKSSSDADASQKLGLAPPNYYRMCKEVGLK